MNHVAAVAEKLSKHYFINISEQDVETWLEGSGEGNMKLVESIVAQFLGNKYSRAMYSARVWDLLTYRLGITCDKIAGGVNLETL